MVLRQEIFVMQEMYLKANIFVSCMGKFWYYVVLTSGGKNFVIWSILSKFTVLLFLSIILQPINTASPSWHEFKNSFAV